MGPSRTARTARTVRSLAAMCAVSLVGLGLAGCSSGPPPSPMPTESSGSSAPTSPSTSATPTTTASSPGATPSGSASVPAGFSLDAVKSPTFPSLGGDIGGIGVVRVGKHTGYDRVVWQFPGSGRPTYQVRYVATPTADGSGDTVAVAGDAYLELMITFVGVPPASAPRPGMASAASLAGTVVAEARPVYGGFEGYGQSFVGVRDHQRPFKVTVLTNPTRVVLDIFSG